MFQDVLLETTPQERRRRKLTLAVTLLGEALVIAVLVAVPLLYLDALPGLSIHEPRYAVPLGETPHIGGANLQHPGGAAHPNSNSIAIIRPYNLHPALPYGPPPQMANTGPGPAGPIDPVCCGDANLPFIPANNYVAPVHLVPPTRPPRVSVLSEGMIIKRVDPVYPQPARIARIEGEVTLRATIGASGQLENLEVVSGHPLLIRAAVDAVQQWRFKPYVLNGSPIEVQSQITVRFVLQQ